MGEGGSGDFVLARMFADIARELLAQETVGETLSRIIELAVSTVPGCEHAGVLVLRAGQVETQVATSDLVRTSDQLQLELGEGPCIDALRENHTYRVDDMARETRWPRYGPKARQLGIGAMLGYQLFTARETLGALDLYAGNTHVFDDHAEEMGGLFASHAAVALAGAQYGAQMSEAVSTRQIIGEAIGILMERYRLTQDAAFDVLRRASQQRNVKLREVARHVAETGEEPLGTAEW